MKTAIKNFVIIFVLFATSSLASSPGQDKLVHVLSTKRYLFHFKVEKELLGGTVTIFDERQNLVRTENILRSKNIVDFFELSAGFYTIKIKKNDLEFVFQYENIE